MTIEKAKWGVNGNNIKISMPFTKIDVEKRLVSGFATLDNVDHEDDIISAPASLEAFSQFAGNIREMHQPIAAGRMTSFVPDTFTDKDGTTYSGIWVSAYVSKGAQSTWEKVLDTTLAGFSIGGEIIDSEDEWSDKLGRMVRKVTSYRLVELSLVDAPCNQLARIFGFEKSAGGQTILKGMITDVKSTSVFYCDKDELARVSTEKDLDCVTCNTPMKEIGWFEYDNDEEVSEKMSNTLSEYVKANEIETLEGGVEKMETENEAIVEEVVEVETVEAVDAVEDGVEAATGAVEEVVEVDDVNEIDKRFEGLKDEFTSALKADRAEVEERVNTLVSSFEEFSKATLEALDKTVKKQAELEEKFDVAVKKVEKMEKSLDELDAATAVKKSNDLGGSKDGEETLVKSKDSQSLWGGRFLDVNNM